jgi:hypothetical protein
MRQSCILCMVLCIAAAQAGWAQVPETMNYQGILMDMNGVVAPDGLYDMTFRIYSSKESGLPLWTESHTGVQVGQGIFSVILGSLSPLAESQTPFDKPYWLGIEVDGGGEISPRIELVSSAYSLNARSVEDSAVTTDKIAASAVTTEKIAPNAVTSEKILDGAIRTDDIDDDAVTLAKIAPEILGSIDGVSNDGGNVDLIAGSGISITPNNPANTITFIATGSGGGDITAVNAGAGLTGGGTSGDVTLAVVTPLSLNGTSADAILSGQNSGTGPGVYGSNKNAGSYGVHGSSTDGWGVYGDSDSNYGVRGESGSSYGMYGSSTSSYGVRGYSGSNDGVYGGTPAVGEAGVYGVNNVVGGYGVRGRSSNGYGVFGESTNNWAVHGVSSANHAVHGQSTDGSGIYGTSVNSYGVTGSSTSSHGVYGTSASGYGVYGMSTNNDGVHGETDEGYGVYGVSTDWASAGVYGVCHSDAGRGVWGYSEGIWGLGVFGTVNDDGAAGVCGSADNRIGVSGESVNYIGVRGYSEHGTAVHADGDMVATGSKPAQVKLDDGTLVRLFCEEAAEVYFTDYGESGLLGGKAHIELDPVFLQTVTIDDAHPMKVFIQVEGDCNGVYVTNKTSTGFDVVELQGGTSNIPFSYRVVCKRKYYEDARLTTPEAGSAITRRMMEKVWHEVIAEHEARHAELKREQE